MHLLILVSFVNCFINFIIMKRLTFIGLSFLLFVCSATGFASTWHHTLTPVQLPADSLIQRIICFKFKANTSPQAIEQHMREFAQLKDSIPHILTYRAGFTVPAELTAKGDYDVMHYCTYRNEEEVKRYAAHPAHQRFIQRNRAIWEKVLVINATFILE
jgi:hypothetical protein